MRQLLPVALIGVALAGAAACAHVQAAAPRSSPLDMPAPPPRVVVPPSADVTESDPPAPATTPAPVATPRPPAAPPARPAEKPPATAPATATPPQPEPTTPVPLETTSDTSALKTQTQLLLNSAQHDLNRIDRKGLSQDAKAQYDRATSFIKQANSALREGNYTYAHTMAEKAAALAGQLPKTKLDDEK